MAGEGECNPSCSLLGLSSRWDSPKQHGLLSTIHQNRASGGGHLRTGALPARHSCGLAQLSCFPFRNLLGQDIMKVFKARVGLTEPSTPTGAQRKRDVNDSDSVHMSEFCT